MTSDLVTQCPLQKIGNDIQKTNKSISFNRIVSKNGSTKKQISGKQQTKSCAVDVNFWYKTCTGYESLHETQITGCSTKYYMIGFQVLVNVLIT